MFSDLSVTPFAELVRLLSADRATGDLEVRTGRVAKTVFFDHGRLVFAASNLKQDRLGEALVALGRITEREFVEASALMRRRDARRRFGEALVQAGVMDKNEVGHSVARQVRRVVLSLFPLADGVASFEERACVIPVEYMVDLSIHRLLYSGIKAMTKPDLIRAGIGDLERPVVLAEVSPFPFSLSQCSEEELEILERCQRRTTLRSLALTEAGLSARRLRAAYALYASGVLRDADPQRAEESSPVIGADAGKFLLSQMQRRPDPPNQETVRREVQQELESSARLDREAWLKVARTAPADELIRALEDKMERYHVLLEAAGNDLRLKTDIELILGRASSMLRLAQQQASAPPPSAAPQAPKRAPKPEAAALTEATPGVDPARVEHLLQWAQIRMTISDYAGAVKTYAELVDLAPEVAAFHLRLAVAMALWPRTAKQAEREFLEAVRLDPDDADVHYQFALYYKKMKLRGRAMEQLRAALSLNPRHKRAREDLETLSPKDTALTTLKKLFR